MREGGRVVGGPGGKGLLNRYQRNIITYKDSQDCWFRIGKSRRDTYFLARPWCRTADPGISSSHKQNLSSPAISAISPTLRGAEKLDAFSFGLDVISFFGTTRRNKLPCSF
ncbi:hypothetical protein Fcan01_04023 [Folsomia candida]|uniref:Uncharacterized protein n=1 Tax=Folsomia candida TaxID=158441 RepID=A0A226EMI9_FOLCA|nr:hypothetical protein Fcan01_04023 [Folsomia candida]